MTLKARNKITPQMADYDQLGAQWVPYLMRFVNPLRSFASVSTDEWGFRDTVGRGGEIVNVTTMCQSLSSSSIGVIIGSSAAFGIGSTHNRFTIPSVLNRCTENVWLNFGGRAFNSTQELILFLLHLPRKVDRLVLFSGVNNITLAFLSSNSSPVYNSGFFQSMFAQALANQADENKGLLRNFSRLISKVCRRLWPEHCQPAATTQTLDEAYRNILHCFSRDLRAFKTIANGLNVPLYFALQPLATWLNKPLAPQEKEIFSILNSISMDWQRITPKILEVRDTYFADMERICRELSVPYCNMNLAPEFLTEEWLFVDRVHLTDRGYEIAANILKKEFAL